MESKSSIMDAFSEIQNYKDKTEKKSTKFKRMREQAKNGGVSPNS